MHAVGYNWLQSNAQSAQRLSKQIASFMAYYKSKGLMCERVILVTHSMGGLVARYYSQCTGGAETVLGVVHGVMPATGSATAYKRVKTGSEMPTGFVLGADAAQMTAVFAQSPGPLQLLPSPEYGMNWLQIRDGSKVVSLPASDPYSQVYTARGEWWSLCDDKLVNPLDGSKKAIEADWSSFEQLINQDVLSFHLALSGKDKTGEYHNNTYAFYGDDAAHSTWGDVVWERTRTAVSQIFGKYKAIDDMAVGAVKRDGGTGSQTLLQESEGVPITTKFSLRSANENGDGTVPIRSGRIANKNVKACVAYSNVDHEGAYKNLPQQLFALWAVTKIAYEVRNTPMAYNA
ncbi:lipase/acyltransferase domain-containing protein [Caballeronia sp. 15715]|uniref:lipase/acyltransferase domain-containing protein n=1 Tax=Caballeronia sp. 15715 TaxID=3391030 RepID=UPI0039E38368